MSDKRYLGNIITPTPTAPAGPYQDSAASGVWSLAEAFAYTKAGLWPTAGNLAPVYAVFIGGYDASGVSSNTMDYVNINTAGNATDFGDISIVTDTSSACASATRGVTSVGMSVYNVLEYITFSTAGNATDFGDLLTTLYYSQACNSSTRGVFAGGVSGGTYLNSISYITIATTGNAVDFGDFQFGRKRAQGAGFSSPTRGIFAGGTTDVSPYYRDNAEYITIASTGNSVFFGNLLNSNVIYMTGASSNTRGVLAQGTTSGNVIQYITIATTGNATDFGDLSEARMGVASGSSPTKAVFGGGLLASSRSNVIDSVTIATTGNATDFGDLTGPRGRAAACSSGNGGLA